MGDFVHLHVHDCYSINDGLCKVNDLVKRAKELGMKSLAITNHGNMYSAVYFYKACKKEGIKPIIGCEVYVQPNNKKKLVRDNRHLVLLAKNETGYKNLVKILSDANMEGFYYNPRTDLEFLKTHSEGLVALSACVGGDIAREYFQHIEENLNPFYEPTEEELQRLYEEAYIKTLKKVKKYIEIFGTENYFLEIQNNGLEDQYEWNEVVYRLAKSTGLRIVCTNDVHYVYKKDASVHDAVMAIQAGKTIFDKNRKSYGSDEFYLKSYDELNNGKVPQESLDITNEIADMCNFDFEFGNYHIPIYDCPEGFNNTEEFLDHIVEEGMVRRYGYERAMSKELQDRKTFELQVIRQMGFNDYFLLTWDFINFCKTNDIAVGPGRGCFEPDNYVLMANGRVKKIKNVKIGDYVLTHKGNIQKVDNVYIYNVDEEMTSLKPEGMASIKCTNDHKILAVKTPKCKWEAMRNTYCSKKCKRFESCKYRDKSYLFEPEWIEANNLNRGDFVVYPKPKLPDFNYDLIIDLAQVDEKIKSDERNVWYETGSNHIKQKTINRFISINNLDLIKVFGIYIGNGYTSFSEEKSSYHVGIAFPEHKYEDLIFCKSIIEETFGVHTYEHWNKKHSCVTLECSSKILAKWFKVTFGSSAKYKCIPDFLMTNDANITKSLIWGLMRSDGHMPTDYDFKLKYSSISYNLISQFKLLLASVGYYSSIHERVHKKHQNWNNEYSLTMSGKQLLILKEDIFPDMTVKKQKYFRNDFYQDENNFYFKIKSKNNYIYKGKVYDLSVPGDTSYIVNQTAVHNSAAGSIVSYAIGITDVDPIRFDLLFFRFLNPDRVGMPDIDVDFSTKNRYKVINYVKEKYGRERVCNIITYQMKKAKSSVRNAGRVLDMPMKLVDKVAKLIPMDGDLREIMEQSLELSSLYQTDNNVKQILDLAIGIQGTPSATSQHAAGIIIAPSRVDDYVPLMRSKDGEPVAAFDMSTLEELGMLKCDFLALKNLDIIDECVELVEKNRGIKITRQDLLNFVDDPNTYKLIAEGKTLGLFQVESEGMSSYAKQMKIANIDELSALLSLYRPRTNGFYSSVYR